MLVGKLFESTEGRYLKCNEGNQDLVKCKDHDGISATNAATLTKVSPLTPSTMVGATGAAPPPGHGVDDFRPTTPGHSPGVGHSVHN
ncbi:Precursor of CEP3, partial [Mucuna pruriens]